MLQAYFVDGAKINRIFNPLKFESEIRQRLPGVNFVS